MYTRRDNNLQDYPFDNGYNGVTTHYNLIVIKIVRHYMGTIPTDRNSIHFTGIYLQIT